MGAIKTAFENIGNGIKNCFEAVGQIAKGALTLDFGTLAKGVSNMTGAMQEVARGAINLTPGALACNTLFDGALDKAMKKSQDMAQSVANGVINTVGNDLNMVKNGIGKTLHGVATGNLGEVAEGFTSTAMGATSLVSDVSPKGLAMNGGMAAVETVVSGPIQVQVA